MSWLRSLLELSPAKITASYVGFGILWILVSDRLATRIAESTRVLSQVQTLKGWVFVGLSGALIFGLTKLRHDQVAETEARLRKSTQQLHVLHRVFRHNVRNDVDIVCGYLDVVRDRLDDQRLDAHLGHARRQVTDLVAISEKLQLVTAVDATAPSDQRVDLVEVVEAELATFRANHPDVTVETTFPDAARVVGDDALRHAIRELLTNAVEHHDGSPADCHLTVAIAATRTHVRVEIADNGPGIPEAELAAFRAGTETQLQHASGVGLWLVHWLCHRYGGDITVEATAAGTTVRLEFEAASRLPGLDGILDATRVRGGEAA